MDLQQFEQQILRLAFETETRITTASVAYYLGIPSRHANELLNALLEEGALELDSDQSGNLYYKVPTKLDESDTVATLKRAIDELDPEHQPRLLESDESVGARGVVVDFDAGSGYSATVRDESDQPAYAPRTERDTFGYDAEATAVAANSARPPSPPQAQHQPAVGTREPQRTEPRGSAPPWFGSQAVVRNADPSASSRLGSSVIATTRAATTDGTVGRSVQSPVLMAVDARCDAQPLAEQRPTLASCHEPVPGAQDIFGPADSSAGHDDWFSANENSTDLVPSNENQLARNYYIDQPEHQPGMALLLSLILCGTGQIYNGEVSKGIMMMVLCFLLWFVLLGWVVHIWSIVDAVVVAERLNRQPQDQ